MSSSEEKTEEPTNKKIKDARKRGEVAISKEFTGAVVYVMVFGLIWFGSSFFHKHINHVISAAFELGVKRNPNQQWDAVVAEMLASAAWIILPIMLLAAIGAILVGLLQTKGVFSVEPLKLKFEKLNPGESLKRLFSSRQLGVLVQMVLKLGLLLTVLLITVRMFIEPLIKGVYGKAADAGATGMVALNFLFGGAGIVFFVLALIDFLQQHFEYIKQNRMSKSELKREYKDNDGDPVMNAHMRSLRREIIETPAKPGMASANVVITNPTHFAVALYYEKGVVDLPVMVAKGQDAAALEIRKQAGYKLVPILENPPLARALFASVELGQYIGDEHLEAVAEVFRWLNSLKSQKAA
jgi:type III secretion protein U